MAERQVDDVDLQFLSIGNGELESRTTFDSDRPAVAKPPRAAGTANLHVLH
jgi:hypothetical protein